VLEDITNLSGAKHMEEAAARGRWLADRPLGYQEVSRPAAGRVGRGR
jgi:hypothetical protein